MSEYELTRIAMTCFLEGIDPSTLALAPGHLARVEALFEEFGAQSDTDGYYRCLETLSSDSPQEVS